MIRWTRKVLTPENRTYLHGLQSEKVVDSNIFMVHGEPGSRDEYLEDHIEMIKTLPCIPKGIAVVLFGHSHKVTYLQEKSRILYIPGRSVYPINHSNGITFINPGGLGQMRPSANGMAPYGFLDMDRLEFTYHATPFDLKRVQQRFEELKPELLAIGLKESTSLVRRLG